MRKICSLAEIPASGCLEFSLQEGEREVRCFLLQHQGHFTAYRNRCPHTGAPLNWNPNLFLNLQGTHIQCDIHGAQFRIDDGYCVAGPCTGRALVSLPVAVKEGEVWLLSPDVPKAS